MIINQLESILRIYKSLFIIIVSLNHESLTAQVARDPARCSHAIWKLLAVSPGFH